MEFSTYVPSTDGTLINTAVPDISGADAPNGLAIHTGNRYVDVVDGGTVTRIDPTTVFPAPLAGGLCCDQVITYVPSAERFFWLMLHCPSDGCIQGASGAGGFRLAMASPADVHTNFQTAWTAWDFTGDNFGRQGAQFDYPDLAYTDQFLIGAIDIGNRALGMADGRVLFRIRLNDLVAAQPTGAGYGFDYIDPAALPYDSGKFWQYSHLVQHGADTALMAEHLDTATIRVLAFPDAGNNYAFYDVKVAKWRTQDVTSQGTAIDYSSPGPDGTNWLASQGDYISGAARTGNQLWLAWTANSGKATSGGFDYPNVHVRVATIDLNTWQKTSEMQVWNPDYAFAYPSLDTSSDGAVGIIVGWGGSSNDANTAEGIIGDYVVWYHKDSTATPNRFGDYITIRRAGDSGSSFAAFGYHTVGTVSGGGFVFNPYYSVFSH